MSTVAVAPSLFEQLGGATNIQAVVEDFYIRVLADDTLRPIFVEIDLDHLRRHQTRFMSYALGGPNQYSGRSMRAAHAGLGITAAQFGAVAAHLDASLASFEVPRQLIDQVIGHVASLQGEVVEG